MDIRKQVGRNLRRLRLECGLSQEALAFEANIARNYMSGLERGVRNPTVLILDRLARVLNVSVSDVVAASPARELSPKNLPRGRNVKRAGRRGQRA
jgi:transcriptional regulator with XRE-family HTH domain